MISWPSNVYKGVRRENPPKGFGGPFDRKLTWGLRQVAARPNDRRYDLAYYQVLLLYYLDMESGSRQLNRCCDFSKTISMTSEVTFNVKVQGQTLNTIKTGNLNARKLHKYTFCEILEVAPLPPFPVFLIPQKVCLQTKSPIPYQPPTSKTKLCKKKS